MQLTREITLDRQTSRPNIILASKRSPFLAPHRGKRSRERSPGGLVQVVEPSLVPGDRWVSVAPDSVFQTRDPREITNGLSLHHARIDARCAGLFDAVCNRVLWFALHGLPVPRLSTVDLTIWWEEGMRKANKHIAATLAREWKIRPAPILIQDFQLSLVPGELREHVPSAEVAFFCHTPFPELDQVRKLPLVYGSDILEGLLSCDLIGFQTNKDLAAFRRFCSGHLGIAVRESEIPWEGRTIRLGVFPATIDAPGVRSEESEETGTIPGDLQVIAWVGRSDPAKNPLGALRSFRRLLREQPSRRGSVVLWMKMDPSRQNLPEYKNCLMEAQEEAVRINAEFARQDWVPVILDFSPERSRAISVLRRADVLLVNSFADGMNLVVQEGVAVSRRNLALVLSRNAGSWEQMADGVISIDPWSEADVMRGLAQGLDMPAAERQHRHSLLLDLVMETTPRDWLASQIDALLAMDLEDRVDPSAVR